jgi:hypothetical protein
MIWDRYDPGEELEATLAALTAEVHAIHREWRESANKVQVRKMMSKLKLSLMAQGTVLTYAAAAYFAGRLPNEPYALKKSVILHQIEGVIERATHRD